MDLDMFNHPATRGNISLLETRGTHVIDAGTGELASGLEGKGRMAEPEKILDELRVFFNKKKRSLLRGKSILINAGPTFENIDPVRYIGNYSTGKMGICLAEEAARRGAKVKLILGPTNIRPLNKNIETIDVVSSSEMAMRCENAFDKADIGILAAAVSDFTMPKQESEKIKSRGDELLLRLKPTKDIAAALGKRKKAQVLVGFALETNNEESNAAAKLKNKNLDLIVLNSLREKGAGFGHDTNRVTLIDKSNNIDKFELKSKEEVAGDILDKVESLL